MNQIVMNLEAAGLVMRRSHPEHGRALQAYLTPQGQHLVGQAHRRVEAVEQRMVAGLNENDWHRLLEALRRCAASLETGAEPETPSREGELR